MSALANKIPQRLGAFDKAASRAVNFCRLKTMS